MAVIKILNGPKDDHPDNRKFFSSRGIKNTKHRNYIVDILKEECLPMTAEQLFLKVKEQDGGINLSTVYRVLDMFVAKGVALKSGITGDNKCVYELNRMQHKHHLICLNCKEMVSLEDDCPVGILEEAIAQKTNYEVKGHKLEVFGYCPNCKLQ